jgi:hypothetical protein
MREFVVPRDTIQEEAAIDINAPPEQVAAIYRDVERWGDTFAATIASAHVHQSGENWKQIEVIHKQEGSVPNTLIDLSPAEIGLQESKHRFDASFLNRFEPTADGGTHYVIHGYVRLKGIYSLLKPFLAGYVRRQTLKQMTSYVLIPLKTAAEKASSYKIAS